MSEISVRFSGNLAIQQRVLPAYRVEFFDHLAEQCGRLDLFAGPALPIEHIRPAAHFAHAKLTQGHNQHVFHPRHKLYTCRQPDLLAWLRHVNPDALIVEANARYLSTPAAIRWMSSRGRPVIGWGLGAPAFNGLVGQVRERFRRRLLRQLDGVIAYSRIGAAQYQKLGIWPQANIFVAPNATAAAPFGAAPRRPTPKRPLRVLFVGRLQARKRIDLLIRACAALKTHKPALTIVGDGPEREALEKLATEHFPTTDFRGALYDDALAAEYRAADLFALPGTGGLAVQDALRYALPVVAAEGDGSQADMVREGNGWSIQGGDLEALIAVLAQASADLGRLPRMGSESYRIGRETANIGQMAKGFFNALAAIRGDTA